MSDYSHIPAPPPPPVPTVPTATPAFELTPGTAPDPVTPRRSRRGLLAGIGALAVLAIVAGVFLASRRDDAEAQSLLARAAAATEAEKSVRVEFTMTGDALPAPIVMTGAIDFAQQASRFEMDLSSLAAAMPDERLSPADARIEVISKGTVTYMKAGMLATLMGDKAKWFKFDASKLPAGAEGALPSGLPQGGTGDPRAALDVLRAEAESVEELGDETVDGVRATHYRAVFDLAKVAARGGPSSAELEKSLGDLRDTTVVYDIWIDGDRLVRKVRFSVDTVEGRITAEMRFFDYGSDVDVTIPSDGDVVDMTKMLGGK